MALQFLAIGLAGFFGAITRYAVGGYIKNMMGAAAFPWGTLIVNITGSFLIGFLVAMAGGRLPVDPGIRTAVIIGFVGSYTTFSTFSFETLDLMANGSWPAAAFNVAAAVVVGLLAVYLGMNAARFGVT